MKEFSSAQWFSSVVEKIKKFPKGRPVSRRQRRARLGLEAREQRDMMSATPLSWTALSGNTSNTIALEVVNTYVPPPPGSHTGFSFLEYPEVEPTNWMGEQAIRPAVVNRKVWGSNRTWGGAHTQVVLMSALETCKRSGRSGLDFVSQTLRTFGNHLLPRPILLTPS